MDFQIAAIPFWRISVKYDCHKLLNKFNLWLYRFQGGLLQKLHETLQIINSSKFFFFHIPIRVFLFLEVGQNF